MITTYKKQDDLLILNQRFYRKFLISLIGISGTILFIISALLLLVSISGPISAGSVSRSFFNSSILTMHFLLTLGAAMISVGFSRGSLKNYSERIIFNNSIQSVEIYTSSSVDVQYIIPYSFISFFRIKKLTGGPDYPDASSIDIIKNDGASFWITSYQSNPEPMVRLAAELAAHTGIAIQDTAMIGAEYRQVKKYPDNGILLAPEVPKFINHFMKDGNEQVSLKSNKYSISNTFTAFILFLFFFSVPFYLLNIFINDNTPFIVHIFTVIFAILWTSILISTIIISMKNYRIILNTDTLKIILSLKILPFINYSIIVPRNDIAHVRTNRIENGITSLSLGVNDSFKPTSKPGLKFTNLSLYRNKSFLINGEKEIKLWEIPPVSQSGYAPGIPDIRYIEHLIQERLQLDDNI